MSNNQILKLRRSAVPGKVPSTSSLDFGELALNTHDGYVFIKKSGSNGEEIVVVGAGSSGSFSGSFFGTSSWAINSVSASYLSGSIGIVNTFTSSGNIRVNNLQLGRSSVYPPHFKNTNIVIGSGSMVNIVSASLNSSGSENIAIGDEILTGPTVAHNNVAIGYKALHRFTGSNGTAVGSYALSSSYGGRNTAFGQSAGIYLTHGAFNTIIGDASMFYTIDGNSNTTVGYGSLANLVSGSHNTAIGTIALRELQTGSFNTVIGSNSGRGLISGSYNTVLGILAALEPYASNNIILADGAGNIRARYSSSIWTLADSTVGNFTGSLQGTASWAENSLTASFAPSYLPLTGGTINGDVIVNGTASISFLNVLYETASVIYSSGSNQFGDASDDVQTLYGTVIIPTGSLIVSGSISSTNGLSGSLYGTSSWSVSASYAKSSSNSAFASTASNILGGAATYIPFFNTNTTLGPSTMFQVSNSFSTTSIAINETNITSDNPEALYVFQTHPTSINVLTGKGNLNNYLQNNIQNTNQGVSASSDVVATANNGNEVSNYIDMGINSENYSAGFVGGANDAYVYSIANNLHIGNANDNGTHVGFFVGGTDVEANNKLQLNPNNQHQMSGSLDVSGSLNVNAGVTASLYGTASWAENSISSSYALTASHALNVPETASYAISASIADLAITASYILNAESSSYALTASYAGNVPETASYSLQALSSSYALTASYANNVPATASYALNAISSSYALSASISQIAISASQAQNSVSSSYPVRISGSTLFTPISPDNVNFSTVSNIFMGPGAGAHASGSNNSVFLGYYTGASASAASFSSFIGYNAGYGATSAVSSVFLGESAGQLASLGSYSVMVGALAGSQATNSLLATFIGYGAGRQASNANNAVFLGREAGSFATEGVGTIAIGTRAGYQNYSASYSIMIGYKAGIRAVTNPNSLGRNNIIIGNSITLDNNRQDSINIGGIIFGTGSYFDTALFNPAFSGSANGRIGINQPFPIFSLDVSGSGRYNNGLEVTGSLIAPNITGSLLGTASWANNALNSVTSSYILNAVSASQAQNAVSSSYPLRVTGSSIYSFDTDQVANVWTIAIGRLTGFQTTAAPFSTFLGVQAGFQAVSASRSVFIGDSSGYQSTNANSSFFAGSAAGGESPNANNSVFIGTSAGYKALNASGSVFLGYNAGEQAVNSAFSNIIGYNAGEFSQSSSFSTLIGYNVGSRVGANSGILSNNIIIGTNITLAAGRQDSINLGGLIFGTGSYSNINTNPFSGSVNGRVGINQPLPLFSLDVSGSGRYSNGLEVTGSLIVKDFLKVDGLLSGSLIPSGSELYDLGSDTNRFRSLYLAGTTIHLGNIKLEENNGTLIIIPDSGSGITETAFSGSFTGSFNGTSSWAINAVSASQSQNTVSSSYALLATTASHALTSLQATSASYANTASVAVSSSYASTSSYAVAFNVSNSLTASGLIYPAADNGEESFIQTDGAGNLSLQYVKTIYEEIYNGDLVTIQKGTPVYVSGSVGAASKVYIADAGNPAKMPVVYVSADTIAPGGTGRGIALGLIKGVNTTGYPAGTEIFVAVGGGWTSVRPTGNSIIQVLGYVTKEGNGGQGVVLNPGPSNLPNIISGYAWVGNSSSYPVAVPTASFFVSNSISSSYSLNSTNASLAQALAPGTNISASSLYISNNITVAGTASFGYVRNITGSAVIIGQEYIILNTQAPAARFAGLQIYDSGSAATASVVWDSVTDHFVYTKASGSSYNGGMFIAGPKNTGSLGQEIGLTQYRIPVAQGDDHIMDSQIYSSGSITVVTGSLTATLGFTGSIEGTASWARNAISSSYSVSASQAVNAVTASYVLNAVSSSFAIQASTASYVLNAVSSSFALSASQAQNAVSASIATTSSLALRNILTASAAGSTITFTKGDNTTFNVTLTTATADTASYISSVNVDGPLGKNSVLSASYALNALTASYILNAVSASYILNAVSSSYALSASISQVAISASQAQNAVTASYVLNAVSASYSLSSSYSLNATSSSFATQASTASYVLNAVSSSYSLSSSYALNSTSSSFAIQASTASYVLNAVSASYALSASQAQNAVTSSYILNAVSSSYALSSSQAQNAVTASYVLNAVSSSFATSASQAQNAVTASYILNAVSASYALSSSQAQNAVSANTSIRVNGTTGQLISKDDRIIEPNSISTASLQFGFTSWDNNNAGPYADYLHMRSYIDSSGGSDNLVAFRKNTIGMRLWQQTYNSASPYATYRDVALVSGSTDNYVPLWTSSTQLINSAIYQSGTNIGIGTTSPSYKFHVVSSDTTLGAFRGSGAANSQLLIGNTAGDLSIRTLSTGDGYIFSDTGKYLDFGTNASFRMRITSAGDVGIGTTSPGAKLEVSGLVRVTGTNGFSIGADAGQNRIQYSTSTFSRFALFSSGDSYTGLTAKELSIGATYGGIAPPTSGIIVEGNVGIGTTTPNAKLDVNGNTIITGSLTATTTFTLDATLTDYATVASSVVGSNNLFNQATGSYTSAFFKYTVTSGSSTRAGEVVAAWNGTSVSFYDNSTVDIGSTTAVTSSVSIVTGNVQFNVQTNTSGWRIKSLATFI